MRSVHLRRLHPDRSAWWRLLPLVALGVAALLLSGCKLELASLGCKKVRSSEVRVAAGQTCRFKYDHGDMAKYVVVVTRPPLHGHATGEGKYLRYVAKPGFAGEDRLGIRVERRGIGHTQWENLTVTVKVGPTV